MINSRKIDDLLPALQVKARLFIERCEAQGLQVLITCTYRDNEAQNALYASGRTAKGKILTNLKGGESKHNMRKAFDFCVMTHGKCDWGNEEAFKKCGAIGEALGLRWAGRWRGKLRELVHFEID